MLPEQANLSLVNEYYHIIKKVTVDILRKGPYLLQSANK